MKTCRYLRVKKLERELDIKLKFHYYLTSFVFLLIKFNFYTEVSPQFNPNYFPKAQSPVLLTRSVPRGLTIFIGNETWPPKKPRFPIQCRNQNISNKKELKLWRILHNYCFPTIEYRNLLFTVPPNI